MGEAFKRVALMGFGATGSPIADLLSASLGEGFRLVATGDRRRAMEAERVTVNGKVFRMRFTPDGDDWVPDIIVVCVKNYDLRSSINDVRNVIGKNTVILPLQNGVFAYDFYRRMCPQNVVLKGFVQGPNTRRRGNAIRYSNSGVIHFGAENQNDLAVANKALQTFRLAGMPAVLDENITKTVWTKWMLNVAGNTVTALTSADYSDFSSERELVRLCRASMNEFVKVAKAEGVALTQSDVDDVINYFVTYEGSKRTSMLEDVIACRRTENEFIAGELVRRAITHGIEVPVTRTLYGLMKVKESLYRNGSLG